MKKDSDVNEIVRLIYMLEKKFANPNKPLSLPIPFCIIMYHESQVANNGC